MDTLALPASPALGQNIIGACEVKLRAKLKLSVVVSQLFHACCKMKMNSNENKKSAKLFERHQQNSVSVLELFYRVEFWTKKLHFLTNFVTQNPQKS